MYDDGDIGLEVEEDVELAKESCRGDGLGWNGELRVGRRKFGEAELVDGAVEDNCQDECVAGDEYEWDLRFGCDVWWRGCPPAR